MWPSFVVLDSLFFNLFFCVIETLNQVNAHPLVAKSSIERFDLPVSVGFPARKKQFNAIDVGPLIHLPRGELGSVVHADGFWKSASHVEILENIDDIV